MDGWMDFGTVGSLVLKLGIVHTRCCRGGLEGTGKYVNSMLR